MIEVYGWGEEGTIKGTSGSDFLVFVEQVLNTLDVADLKYRYLVLDNTTIYKTLNCYPRFKYDFQRSQIIFIGLFRIHELVLFSLDFIHLFFVGPNRFSSTATFFFSFSTKSNKVLLDTFNSVNTCLRCFIMSSKTTEGFPSMHSRITFLCSSLRISGQPVFLRFSKILFSPFLYCTNMNPKPFCSSCRAQTPLKQ